jgi:hypothetical protein
MTNLAERCVADKATSAALAKFRVLGQGGGYEIESRLGLEAIGRTHASKS